MIVTEADLGLPVTALDGTNRDLPEPFCGQFTVCPCGPYVCFRQLQIQGITDYQPSNHYKDVWVSLKHGGFGPGSEHGHFSLGLQTL